MSEPAIETLPATIQNISVDEKDKEVVKSDEVREAKSEVSTQSAVTLVQCPPHVPQHLMGVDVNGTSTEVTGTGKRIPKPRLGVKVPYRNLTSQIVTQDEIAQEILERSLKKYPYQKFENSDLLFTMKLTNHFQNRIPSPSTAVAATSQTLHTELTHEEEEDNRIKDNKELLAILDGSPEISSEKTNVGKKNIRQEGKGLSPSPYKFIKMYPELEKELALKQLEEFTKPRKKKPETGTDVNKQNGKSKLLKRVKNEMENNNNIEKKTETCLNVMAKGKPGRKRKIATPPDSPKRKRVLKSTNGDTHQPTASTVADVSQITEVPTVEDGTLPTVPPVKDSKSIKKYVNRRLASRSDEDPDSLENADALNGSLSGDNEPDSYRIESSSPKMKKTVSPRKSDNANVNNINKQKVSDIQENNSQNTTTPMGRKKQTRVMREIDRLLGDEGAINMLYSVEQKRTPGNTPNRRGILPSARRKKKDLLLKTRLVKNAVLRLSNSPTQSSAKTALRVRRHSNPTEISEESQVKAETPQRKMSIESAAESLQSASLNSPVHSPSFAYPTKLSVPAEASRIIRRHSSSSSYSSRSNSPRRPSIDTDRSPVLPQSVPSSPEKSITDADGGRSNSPKKNLLSSLKKPDGTFYCDKTKQMLHAVNDSKATVNELSERAERLMDMKIKEAENQIMNKILENKDDSTNLVFKKDISNILKNNFNAEFKKSIKKNLMAAKLSKPKRTTLLGNVGLSPETQLQLLKALSKQESCAAAAAEAGSSTTSPSEPSTSVARGSAPSSSPVFRNCNAANYLKEILGDGQKKRDGEEKPRSSVRQNAGSYTYREINLRRYEHLVQIILTPISTKMKNAFNVQVFKEMTNALNCLRKDDTCRVVLLTSTGSAFCHGIDLTSLIHATPEKRKSAAIELVLSLRNFIKCLATFNKPLIAGVHGAAVGLGVTMLPFFDMVVASDKATFHTPYARLGQIPEGAATLTLPQMLGNAVTSELLFGCRKLTASEALHFGLVTRILWPDRFQEELIPLIRGIATQSSQSMEATKALLRSNLCSKLDNALLSESQILLKHWMSNECQNCFKQYLEEETPTLQK